MNILIRPLTVEDAAVSYKWRNDPEVWKFTGSRPSKEITAEIERDWLKKSLGDKSKTRFAILVDGVYVGNVQLTDIIINQSAEFHIFIGEKSFWGKGVAKEATYQILHYAKDVLNLHSVFLDVNKENLSAINSYRKNGFVIVNETHDSIRMLCDIQNLKPPKVSVFCMVYNHEKYISQAIEGFLMQKTSFNSVMVIGEDCSTDGSRSLILEYAKKYPGKFKLLLNDKNIGAHKNQELVLKNCMGKYIAMCEGDDYWTDPFKLQKQVDFLEQHPKYSGSFHNTDVINEMEFNPQMRPWRNYTKSDFVLKDTLSTTALFHTSSFMFRADTLKIPLWLKDVQSADMALFTIMASQGPLYRIDESMSVYRKNETGITNSIKQIEYHTNRIKLFEYFKCFLNGRENEEIKKVIDYHKKQLKKLKKTALKDKLKQIFKM